MKRRDYFIAGSLLLATACGRVTTERTYIQGPSPSPEPSASPVSSPVGDRGPSPGFRVTIGTFRAGDGRLVHEEEFDRVGRNYRAVNPLQVDGRSGTKTRVWIRAPHTYMSLPMRMRVLFGCRSEEGIYSHEAQLTDPQQEIRNRQRVFSATLANLHQMFRICRPDLVSVYVELIPTLSSGALDSFQLNLQDLGLPESRAPRRETEQSDPTVPTDQAGEPVRDSSFSVTMTFQNGSAFESTYRDRLTGSGVIYRSEELIFGDSRPDTTTHMRVSVPTQGVFETGLAMEIHYGCRTDRPGGVEEFPISGRFEKTASHTDSGRRYYEADIHGLTAAYRLCRGDVSVKMDLFHILGRQPLASFIVYLRPGQVLQ